MNVFNLISEDKELITYRRSFAYITKDVKSAIFLQQILYWWNKNNRQPFYKFNKECKHALYKQGDSWSEELCFSCCEIRNSLNKIGLKIDKDLKAKIKNISEINGTSYRDELQKECCNHLVLYWTNNDRLTYYSINESLLVEKLEQYYNKKSKGNQSKLNDEAKSNCDADVFRIIKKAKIPNSTKLNQLNKESLFTYNTENTPETNPEKEKINKNNDRLDKLHKGGKIELTLTPRSIYDYFTYKAKINGYKNQVTLTQSRIKDIETAMVENNKADYWIETISKATSDGLSFDDILYGSIQFKPPTLIDIKKYMVKNEIDTVDPSLFYEYYTDKDWKKLNGEYVRNWKSTIRNWSKRNIRKAYENGIEPERYIIDARTDEEKKIESDKLTEFYNKQQELNRIKTPQDVKPNKKLESNIKQLDCLFDDKDFKNLCDDVKNK